MRWVMQLLVPALIVVVIALVLTRNRTNAAPPNDQGPLSFGALFGLILVGAALAIGLVYALQGE